MSAEIVLDTNVLVAWLDEHDALAKDARSLLDRIAENGDRAVLIDVAVSETLSDGSGNSAARRCRKICAFRRKSSGELRAC